MIYKCNFKIKRLLFVLLVNTAQWKNLPSSNILELIVHNNHVESVAQNMSILTCMQIDIWSAHIH